MSPAQPPPPASAAVHPSRPLTPPTGPTLDEDPFARLTDEDLHHLSHHPGELAEELRFGSYWLAHADGEAPRAHARALEVAAEVIERLAAHQGAEPAATDAALRLADAALARRRPATSVSLLREHVEAFAAWSDRLDHYLDELRAVLDAHESGAPPARRPAQSSG